MKKRHRLIALGGTFDHFHDGHAHFLRFAHRFGEKLLIGVTHPQLTSHKLLASTIEPYVKRVKNVVKFCREEQIPCEAVQLSDHFGPAISDERIQGLAVTQETIAGGEKINEVRVAQRLPRLPIYICDLLPAENNQPLHSEDIRAGHVNRQGLVYSQHCQQTVKLNSTQRTFLHKPLGVVLHDLDQRRVKTLASPVTAIVGDITLNLFQKQNLNFDLAVIDGHSGKDAATPQPVTAQIDLRATNPAGTISQGLIKTLSQALSHKHKYILVDGEEDLATAALIMLLPLESEIYYGQPGNGIVQVTISEALKDKILHLLYVTAN